MRKTAWISVLGIIGFIYVASSIPGLRVLPILRYITSIFSGFDYFVEGLSLWIARQIPLNFGELAYIDTVIQDLLAYMRQNPILIEFFLRKLAHVIVFFFLTIAIFFLLYQYISRASICLFLSFIAGFALAVLDEYRQSFVPDRVASAVDVFVDMIGVTLAIIVIIFSLIVTSGDRYRYFKHKGMLKKQRRHQLSSARKFMGTYKKIE